jgi:transcriptional regulator with XRE-family HTH domain
MSPRRPFTTDSSLARLGQVVKTLRKEAGLTQVGLAARADIDNSLISRIEGGDHNPTWATLSRLSYGLEVPRWVLVKRADELGRG